MNWISFAAGALLVLLIGGLAHIVDVDHIEKKQATALIDQQASDKRVCDSDKAITKESNDALQKDHDAIAARLTKLMQQPAACVPVSQPAQLCITGKTGHAKQNGISSSWLRSFAAECEGYRRELNTCIDFTNHLPQK